MLFSITHTTEEHTITITLTRRIEYAHKRHNYGGIQYIHTDIGLQLLLTASLDGYLKIWNQKSCLFYQTDIRVVD